MSLDFDYRGQNLAGENLKDVMFTRTQKINTGMVGDRITRKIDQAEGTILKCQDDGYVVSLDGREKGEDDVFGTFEAWEFPKYMSSKSESIIWAHMSVGVTLTDKDSAIEFFTRAELWHKVNYSGALPFTIQDVIRHIGLKTNVSPKTRPEFLSSLKDGLRRALINRSEILAEELEED